MMFYTYAGTLQNIDGDWLIEFPQFEGCFGGGSSIEDACVNAAEALRLFIADFIDDDRMLPAVHISQDSQFIFTVEVNETFIAETKCITQAEAAEMLGLTTGRIAQLLDAGKLETYESGGKRLVTIASVNKRLEEKPKAGRPKKEVVK